MEGRVALGLTISPIYTVQKSLPQFLLFQINLLITFIFFSPQVSDLQLNMAVEGRNFSMHEVR
jgi:hypothetical protein